MAPQHIPLFAVGYKGWQRLESLQGKLNGGVVDGILTIDPPMCSWSPSLQIPQSTASIEGSWALWGLIMAIQRIALSLNNIELDLSFYARPDVLILKRLSDWSRNDAGKIFSEHELINIMQLEFFQESFFWRTIDSLKNENLIEFFDMGAGEDSHSRSVKVTETGRDLAQTIKYPCSD